MLVVINQEHYDKTIAEAKENDTWEDKVSIRTGQVEKRGLQSQLRYLHEYGGLEDPKKFKVEVGYDSSGFGITWLMWSKKEQEYHFFMNGGLIFFARDKSWSVHT